MGMRLALALLWLLQFAPTGLRAGLARLLAPLLARTRAVRTARTNIALCFAGYGHPEQRRIEQRYLVALIRSVLELGIAWFAPAARLRRLISLQGLEHYQAVADGPVIFLAMHCVGLEIAGARMGLDFKGVGFFTPHKNALLDRVMRAARDRLGDVLMLDRREGLRPMVRAIRAGRRLYFLPDQDFGARDALFVPFFGVAAATVTTLPRLVALTGARVVPVQVCQLPGTPAYRIDFGPAWTDFPSADLQADVARMNDFVEAFARAHPDQYFWGHKRFRTRPPGDTRDFYR